MRCTREVQRECKYARYCGPDCEVADDSECAEFIMSVTMRRVEAQEAADAVEAEYLRQERQAIQEECTP
jgi:hypothetical protein